jgi:hypothetical protein
LRNRERLAREAGMLRELASRGLPKQSRYLRTEVRHLTTIDVAGVLAEADRLSRAHRELDTRIQQATWGRGADRVVQDCRSPERARGCSTMSRSTIRRGNSRGMVSDAVDRST